MEARPHGTIEVVNIGIEVAMTTMFTLQSKLPRSFVVVGVCVTSLLYFYMYYKYLPFYSITVNNLHITHASVFVWACFCLVLAELQRRPEVCGTCLACGMRTAVEFVAVTQ